MMGGSRKGMRVLLYLLAVCMMACTCFPYTFLALVPIMSVSGLLSSRPCSLACSQRKVQQLQQQQAALSYSSSIYYQW